MSHLNSGHVQVGQAVVDLAGHLLRGLGKEGLGEVVLVAANDLGGLEHIFAGTKGDAILASSIAGRGRAITGQASVDALIGVRVGVRQREEKEMSKPWVQLYWERHHRDWWQQRHRRRAPCLEQHRR
jgi:hypothetical protein